jgi:hypothetical protein
MDSVSTSALKSAKPRLMADHMHGNTHPRKKPERKPACLDSSSYSPFRFNSSVDDLRKTPEGFVGGSQMVFDSSGER